MTEDDTIKEIKKPGKFDATVASEAEARRLVQTALPHATELPPAVAGQPYPSPPKEVKAWFQVHPPDATPGPGRPNLPHIKYADWTGGKRGRGGSWGHIFFPLAGGNYMMVTYQPTDTISINAFEFAWRITDAQWSSLPEPVLKHIKPFSAGKSKEVLAKSPFHETVDRPFDPAQYHASRQVSLEGESNFERERVKTWLYELPVPANQEVYLCWQVGDGVAAVIDWSTFVEIWDDLWYPFDRLYVFDETQQWALLLGPEEQGVFIERNSR